MHDLVYIAQYNIYTIYLAIHSLINSSVFGYRVSIVLMFHNALLIICILMAVPMNITLHAFLFVFIILILFVMEGLFSIYVSYLRRYDTNFELFKKVGADPAINDAFFLRKSLETLGSLNTFIAVTTFGRYAFHAFMGFELAYFLFIALSIITFFQQLFVYVNFYNENVQQRKVAKVLSIIKLVFHFQIIIVEIFLVDKNHCNWSPTNTLFLIDSTFLTLATTYFLWCDTSNFGIGLKDYLKSTIMTCNLES